jgi:hypothetical protein
MACRIYLKGVSFEKIRKYIPAPTKNGAFHSQTKSENLIINSEI